MLTVKPEECCLAPGQAAFLALNVKDLRGYVVDHVYMPVTVVRSFIDEFGIRYTIVANGNGEEHKVLESRIRAVGDDFVYTNC